MKDIWESVPFLLKPTESYQSFGSWFDFLSRCLSKDFLLSAAVICWKKWDVHNQRLHGSEHLKMNELVGWCSSFLRAFRDAQLPKHSIPRCAASPTWSPPPGGWVKLNVDVALKNGEKFYNTSLVARNSYGECLWWEVRLVLLVLLSKKPLPFSILLYWQETKVGLPSFSKAIV
ncbi:hypothetical protein ACP275_14G135100 [Erythranthe tilingii]